MLKLVRYLYGCLCIIALLAVMTGISGCGKKNTYPLFEYIEDDNGQLHITGLTDTGKMAESITIPAVIEGKNVISVDRGAFNESSSVKEVIIEEGIASIGENAFFNCYRLEKVSVPASITYVGTNVFKGTAFEKAAYDTDGAVIVNCILASVKPGLSEYTVPDGVKIIAPGVFYNNTMLEKVNLPDSLEIIGNFAFSGCTSLTELTLNEGLKRIEYAAFGGCTNLSVTVPEGVSYIGTDAFLDVKEVKEVK